jgi:hypothetical protein
MKVGVDFEEDGDARWETLILGNALVMVSLMAEFCP